METTTTVQTPPPLDHENNEEVRTLAKKLAPTLERAEEILQEFTNGDDASNNSSNDINDGLEDEIEDLEWSEQLLRQELEMAQHMALMSMDRDSNGKTSNEMYSALNFNRYSSPPKATPRQLKFEADVEETFQEEEALDKMLEPHHSNKNSNRRQTSASSSTENMSNSYSEPDISAGTGYTISASLNGSKNNSNGNNSSSSTPSTPVPAAPFTMSEPAFVRDESFVSPSVPLPKGQSYNHSDHYKYLGITGQTNGYHSIDLTRIIEESYKDKPAVPPSLHEYCLSIPDESLQRLYVGLPEKAKDTTLKLPVRCLALRIRPDVLCGAVMDAVYQALTPLHAVIEKRQGGHLSAIIPGAVCVVPTMTSDYDGMHELVEDQVSNNENVNGFTTLPEPVEYPAFRVDTLLCTGKTENLSRTLLIRIYHLETNTSASPGDRNSEPPSIPISDTISSKAVQKLREACALLQRMRTPEMSTRIRPRSNSNMSEAASSVSTIQTAVSKLLLDNYRACPSVKEGRVTFPSLNSVDYPVMESSSRLVSAVWDELETRDLTYSTLASARFGAFPALPTLDVHYCSQLRRLSRENMIVHLLQRASDLEEYAREAEYKCANLIALLQPTFESYSVTPPPLPRPVPLTAYPLKFISHQATCPPWGIRVMESLNEIQAWTSDAGIDEPIMTYGGDPTPINSQKSLEMAQQAVKLVYLSFEKQDDEEQSARLDRKNVQVMDRLAKMQAHQRASLEALEKSVEDSEKAASAAEDFRNKSGHAEVPILKWGVVVGSSTGTCIISANHLLFATQRIPVIGGSKVVLFDIRDVEFGIEETSPSLLNPLPTILTIRQHGKVVYSFRPSSAGARLKTFLETIKSVAVDEVLECSIQSDQLSPSAYA